MTYSDIPTDLPWYVHVNRFYDDAINNYECTCCHRNWKPYEMETHYGTCDRKERKAP